MDSDELIGSSGGFAEIHEAVMSHEPVTGLTHAFYRYPACFPPGFAESVITAFSEPGDVVLDPYMGGGTAVVEAHSLGRRAFGGDISALANFITRVKTTVVSDDQLTHLEEWLDVTLRDSNLHQSVERQTKWSLGGYQRNISGPQTWPIRKLLEIFLSRIPELGETSLQCFARCLLLRTAKWALDCREVVPTAQQFRDRLPESFLQMSSGARELRCRVESLARRGLFFRPETARLDVKSIAEYVGTKSPRSPRLILTSPPYPGVHVLYHRWQVKGRRETPAPFWIAGCEDGNGAAHYTLGDRKQKGWKGYFRRLQQSYRAMAQVSDQGTILVQLLAFSHPDAQLALTLSALDEAGFVEFKPIGATDSRDGRMWRTVPNRRWYARQKGELPSSSEVVLFHRFP